MLTSGRDASDALLDALAARVDRLAAADGMHTTALPGLMLMRWSRPGTSLHCVQHPALCVIVRGSKELLLANETYRYDAARYLVAQVDLPVVARILRASPARPYLSISLDLDPTGLAELLLQPGPPRAGQRRSSRGVFVEPTSPLLLEAVLRLVRLLDTPEDLPVLAPLTVREILYRVLRSEHGWQLAELATANSRAQRVAAAVGWIRAHFTEPLRIEEVARLAHMSSSALHHHFKAVTNMSPLQYQKQLRLQGARKLMLSDDLDAAGAAFRVGYESASQFSREYRRLFGQPPARDLLRLRRRARSPAAG
jgi:AraC-like DNA-binding protein